MALHDMHCHLDFMANAEEVAHEARDAGSLLFANTVTPEGWQSASERFAPYQNVVTGFGLHPWWVETDEDAARAASLLREHQPRVIGEVGLDLSRRHSETASAQRAAFRAILEWAAAKGGRLVSIHSVHAAGEALDALESTGAAESCACIFHWFTGPSDQLKRAVQMGCYFSFGPRALATGKGREYVKAVPVDRLLLETDYPPKQGDACSFGELEAELASAVEAVAAIKKTPDALEVIEETSRRLLAIGV